MSFLCSHPFHICLNFEQLSHHLLIIENKKMLYSFLKDMKNGGCDKDYFEIWDDKNKKLKNGDYIDFNLSLFYIEINNKKNLNALIRILKNSCFDLLECFSKNITLKITETFNNLKLESPIEIISDIDVTDDDFFKLVNLSIAENDDSILERIYNYIKVSFELRNIRIFVFYNLYSLLDNNEIENLLKSCTYLNVRIINVEPSNIQNHCFETKKILDKDICLLESNQL